jgi:hypothetical protein
MAKGGDSSRAAPPGYVWDGDELFSVSALDVLDTMSREAEKRMPQLHDMFISPEFQAQGVTEVLENELLGVYEFLVEEQSFTRAFRHLEGMLGFLERYDEDWTGIDDDERVGQLTRVLGAAWVTTLKGLQEEQVAHTATLPNLQQVLKRAIRLGNQLNALSKPASNYPQELEVLMSGEVRAADGNQEAEDDLEEDFDFEEAFNAYESCYGMGGDEYDLTLWSASEKELYLFENVRKRLNEEVEGVAVALEAL